METVEEALSVFALGPEPRARLDALQVLFTLNATQRVQREKQFLIGVRSLLASASAGGQRLEAASGLGRILRGVKPLNKSLLPDVKQALNDPLPPAAEWASADDRRFVAQAVSTTNPLWGQEYATEFLVSDENSLKAREVFFDYLISICGSIESVLDVFYARRGEFARREFSWRSRQVRSILSGIASNAPVGTEVGARAGIALGNLVEHTLSYASDSVPPQDIRVAAAEQVLEFLELLIRGSASTALEARSYRAAHFLRRWFEPGRWPLETREVLARISGHIVDAIAALAIRGVVDDDLFRALAVLLDRDAALERTRTILEANPGIPSSVHAWLQRGPGAANSGPSESAHEASLRKADPNIARALTLAKGLQLEATRLLDQGDGLENGPSNRARMARLITELSQTVRLLASTRGLKSLGSPGDVVPFDPHLHRFLDGAARTATVRLVQPAVVRQVGGAAAVVVQPGVVEAVN